MSFWNKLFGAKDHPTARAARPPAPAPKTQKEEKLPPLCEAAKGGNAKEVQRLLSAGEDRDACDEEGQSALHYAALCGHADIVEILLAAGADVDAKNSGGVTPLHLAATLGNPSVAKALMFGEGANTDARDDWGWTAIHKALILDRVEFIRALAEGGADLEATIMITAATPSEFAKLSGMTALELAYALGKTDCAKALIAAGAKSKS
jgi:ankyrin repeat protein